MQSSTVTENVIVQTAVMKTTAVSHRFVAIFVSAKLQHNRQRDRPSTVLTETARPAMAKFNFP